MVQKCSSPRGAVLSTDSASHRRCTYFFAAPTTLSGAATLSGADRLNIITKKQKEPNNNSGVTKSSAAAHLWRCRPLASVSTKLRFHGAAFAGVTASALSRRHSRRCLIILPKNNSPSRSKHSATKILNARITEFHAIYTVEAVCGNRE